MLKGERLKELRKQKGLTQQELGDILGVTKASICCYEKETRTPNMAVILELIEYFGVTADYLIGTDVFTTVKNNSKKSYVVTKEEIEFILELRKDKYVYSVLLEEPLRGIELLKKKIG